MKKANGGRAERQRERERVESAGDDSDQYYSDDDGYEESRPGAVRVHGIHHVTGNVSDDNETINEVIGSKDNSVRL